MIYLDANSTSRIRPAAQAAGKALLEQERFITNPSSVHTPGRAARALLEEARQRILTFLGLEKQGGKPHGVKLVFTSGGTESANLMLAGYLSNFTRQARRHTHIVSSAIEHPSLLEPLREMAENGVRVSLVSPERNGVVDIRKMCAAVSEDTELVTLMAANNETGAIQDVQLLAQTLRQNGFAGVIVTDVSQALLKSELQMSELFRSGVNAIGFSGHKLGAPAGIGAVVLATEENGCRVFTPLLRGGSQENRFRGGTENLIGAVMLGATAVQLNTEAAQERARLGALRLLLQRELSTRLSGLRCLTEEQRCLSNTLCLHVADCRGDDLVVALDLLGVCVSTGAACSSGKQEVSHVYRAMGLGEKEAREVIRISLDWDANEEMVIRAAERIEQAVGRIRNTEQRFDNYVSH